MQSPHPSSSNYLIAISFPRRTCTLDARSQGGGGWWSVSVRETIGFRWSMTQRREICMASLIERNAGQTDGRPLDGDSGAPRVDRVAPVPHRPPWLRLPSRELFVWSDRTSPSCVEHGARFVPWPIFNNTARACRRRQKAPSSICLCQPAECKQRRTLPSCCYRR